MSSQKNLNRTNLIKKIISYEDVTDQAFAELSSYEWDFDGNPVSFGAQDIRHILKLYLDKKISAQDIDKWANFLECRDDVEPHVSIAEILFELANPDIQGELTEARAKALLLKL